MTLFLLIFFLLLIAYGVLIDYYRRVWKSIPEYAPEAPANVPVSVIVAVRDEEQHIEQLLNCLHDQHYPKNLYEIIIVDDHSTDGTYEKINAFHSGNLSIKIAALDEGITSKKQAIAEGIKIASGDLIITIDADCLMGPSWISIMASYYISMDAKFIAAPVSIPDEHSMLGIFQSLDFLALQGITGASVYKKFHSMCNGANLAYSKTAFNEVNGFEGIDHIPSGDDMLLMHKIFDKYPDQVFYLKNTNAIVSAEAEHSWKGFFNQRIRWASKAVHYRDKRIFYVLLLTYLVNVCFVVLTIASFFNYKWFMFLLLFFLAKILIEFPFVNAVAIFFRQSSLMRYFPFLQPVHIIYTIIAGWLGRFGSYKWKSRVIKNI